MKVVEYLNSGNSLEKLNEELGIKISQNENYPDLFCLNYCQINSPKFDPIVRECRSLVLSLVDGIYQVESRAFDRFFNYGEDTEEHDPTRMYATEKIDGSLVSVWWSEKYGWLYRTKSMIMPAEDMKINGWDLSWKELIESTIFTREFQDADFLSGHTYIFEVVSLENRVVTIYHEKQAYLLGIRDNRSGDYIER